MENRKLREHKTLFTLIHSVIAGESMGAQSPVRTQTPVYYLDFEQQPGARVVQEVPQSWNAFLYVLSGMIKIRKYGRGKRF